MFSNSFPFVDSELVRRVVDLIPLKTYGNVTSHTTDNEINYSLKQVKLSFPDRLYSLEIPDKVISTLDNTEKIILHCLYTRSCDGYVREKHIKALLSQNYPDWAIPYMFKVCDEYVVEILQLVYEKLNGKNTDEFKAFCLENRKSFCNSYHRMTSYWNEYYRTQTDFNTYVGRKLFVDCFGYSKQLTR